MKGSADKHGGNLRELAEASGIAAHAILDFSANINPLSFPDCTREVIAGALSSLQHYPDKDYVALHEALGRFCGVSCDEVVAVNGTSEAISLLPRILGRTNCIIQSPCFSLYERAAVLAGMTMVPVPLVASADFATDYRALEAAIRASNPAASLVFLGHPNNPTGGLLDVSLTVRLAREFPEALFVIDEAFIDFAPSGLSMVGRGLANVIVLRSLTKILALPGLRIGFVVASPTLTAKIKLYLPPWNVNELASRLVIRVLADENDFFTQSRLTVDALRDHLERELAVIGGLKVYPSAANFLMVRLAEPTGPQLLASLLKHGGIALRDLSKMAGLDERYLRIAVRRDDENGRLLTELKRHMHGADRSSQTPARARGKKLPPLMLLGTGSDVGKSVLTAALCRIFVQDGLKVAPFKAQNMALNSFVTRDGGEIGRAQAVQAQACKIDIDVRMNPILLKPASDHTSQVIVEGKPIGTFSYTAYLQQKTELFARVKGAFRSLADEYDLVVMEGAGGASEINLKKNDIVNMAMARAAGARVLIVGDIDRGGVFGALVGTLETMVEWERRLVRGMIINKFRGKKELLQGGLDYLERRLGQPVLGVVPHVERIDVPDEDSVGFKRLAALGAGDFAPADRKGVEVVVIDTPRISNFTDIDPLRLEPDVTVRVVRDVHDFGRPDVVILAGSKNVIADLQHLKESGMGAVILAHAGAGGSVVGICGGLQMMGRRIEDPQAIESNHGGTDGFGLLALDTCLHSEKILGRTRACTPDGKGVPLVGYEIHHGISEPCDPSCQVSLVSEQGRPVGFGTKEGNVWGTYLHGIFDGDEFRRRFIDELRSARGLIPVGHPLVSNSLEAALDRLADTVRSSLDMDKIYSILRDN